MKIFNIMLSRELGGIQQSFIDYNLALRLEGHEVINITSSFAEINARLPGVIRLPNLFQWCLVSKIYLRILVMLYSPDLILSHGGRAISFASFLKPNSIPLIGIAHNYKTKRLKQCDYIISVTDILIQHLTTKGFDKKKLFHLQNMIKINHVYQEKKYQKPVIIGSCGRFVSKKGFHYLIEAIFLLKNSGHNVKLLLGGEGQEADALRKLVNDMNLDKEVQFLGWIEDKDKFFEQIDIFCLPSTSEPFGIILLEAIAHSTPIIATKSGGPAEILRDKIDALMVKTESSKDIADKLKILMKDENLAKSLAKSAYLRLVENYDIKVVSKKLGKLVTNLAS